MTEAAGPAVRAALVSKDLCRSAGNEVLDVNASLGAPPLTDYTKNALQPVAMPRRSRATSPSVTLLPRDARDCPLHRRSLRRTMVVAGIAPLIAARNAASGEVVGLN